MRRIVAERYPLEDWNIYAAQASDGDNYSGDSETCWVISCFSAFPGIEITKL